MGWRSPRSDRRSFGGSTSHHFGWLDPAPEEPLGETVEAAEARTGQSRIRSSAKQQEIREALKAGASARQINALLSRLETLADELGPSNKLDWSVRFEPRERSLCLRWRQIPTDGSTQPPAWQTQGFGGRAAADSPSRNSSRRGFG